MNQEKLKFLTTEFPRLLTKLKAETERQWGKMGSQQMIEHMSDAFRTASGKIIFPVMTPAEQLPAFREFLFSEKDFKPNTKNLLMQETPEPIRNEDIPAAIKELENEIAYFVSFYTQHPDENIASPFFGLLKYDEQVHLLHKHALHHCRQFGLL